MTSATAQALGETSFARPTPAARRLVVMVFVLAALFGTMLLAASSLPTGALAGRLLGAAGEARAGTYTQDLLANLGLRLRLAGAAVLVLTAALVVLRTPFEQMLASAVRDLAMPRWRWLSRAEVLAVGAAMLLGLGLRLAFITQPIRYDEALTFNEFASRPLYYGLSFYPDPNNHLLNTLLMHLAFTGLGNQPWVLRLPALLGGVLLVPATYCLGRLLYGWRPALLATALVAVSSYLVEYSTNGRGYTLQALCFVVMLGLGIVAVRRDSPTALLLAVVAAALGAYTLPTMLYGVCVAAAWLALLLRGARPRRIGVGHLLVSGVVLGLLVLLLYLPVILISGPDKLAGNRFVVPLDAAELVYELPRSLARTFEFWNRDVPWPLGAALLVGFGLATARELLGRRVPPGVLAPLVCLVLVLVQRVAPFERVWLFLLPLYFVITAGGLARYLDGRLLAVVFGAVLGYLTLTSGSILASGETGTFSDAEAVAQSLRGRLAANDAVLTTIPASLPELQYYFPRAGLPIEPLVREPSAAARLYVLVPPGSDAPGVAGWQPSGEPQPLRGSAIIELERRQGN